MVCLTSCVFRSIRFSGFARPHIGVRREGELYTQAQGEGKRGKEDAQDGHKMGDNRSLGGFPEPRAPDQPGRWGRRGALDRGARSGAPITVQGRL